MQIKQRLSRIVGAANVSDDPAALLSYSTDCSLSTPRMPNFIARPKSTKEVQGIVKLANDIGVPVVPEVYMISARSCPLI